MIFADDTTFVVGFYKICLRGHRHRGKARRGGIFLDTVKPLSQLCITSSSVAVAVFFFPLVLLDPEQSLVLRQLFFGTAERRGVKVLLPLLRFILHLRRKSPWQVELHQLVHPTIVVRPFTILVSGGLGDPLPLLDIHLLLPGNDVNQVAANLFYFVCDVFLVESRMLGPFISHGHLSH